MSLYCSLYGAHLTGPSHCDCSQTLCRPSWQSDTCCRLDATVPAMTVSKTLPSFQPFQRCGGDARIHVSWWATSPVGAGDAALERGSVREHRGCYRNQHCPPLPSSRSFARTSFLSEDWHALKAYGLHYARPCWEGAPDQEGAAEYFPPCTLDLGLKQSPCGSALSTAAIQSPGNAAS